MLVSLCFGYPPCFEYPRILSISVFLVFPWFCYPCVFGTPVPKSLLFRVFPLGLRIPKTKRRELNSGLWQLTWRSRFTCRSFIISKGKDHRKVKCKMEDGAWPSGCDKSGRNLWNVLFFFFFFFFFSLDQQKYVNLHLYMSLKPTRKKIDPLSSLFLGTQYVCLYIPELDNITKVFKLHVW